MRALATITGLAVAAPLAATAHHGAEFAALESFEIGHPGDGYLLSSFDFESFSDGDETSSEVSLFLSPLPRIGIGADVRFAETSGGSWDFSSVTPRITLQLSDPHGDSRVKFGMSIGYQFARDLRETTTRTTVTETVTREDVPTTRTVTTSDAAAPATTTEPTEPDCNPLFDLDCPTSKKHRRLAKHGGVNDGDSTTSSTTSQTTVTGTEQREVVTREETTTTSTSGGHSGIHNHDESQWIGRLTAETYIGKTQIVGNLIATLPEGDRVYWGYGVGARHPISKRLALGAEFIGDFDSSGEHEAIGSVLYDFRENTTLRISAGTGLTSESPDYTLRAALLWRF